MKIKGKSGQEYNVTWSPYGWSYAISIVYVKKKFLGFISYDKKVWEGSAKSLIAAAKCYPDEMIKWFKSAVEEYENYVSEWSQHDLNLDK